LGTIHQTLDEPVRRGGLPEEHPNTPNTKNNKSFGGKKGRKKSRFPYVGVPTSHKLGKKKKK